MSQIQEQRAARTKPNAAMTARESQRNLVDEFHRLYYGSASQTWSNTFWLGVNVYKCPLDLWIYQELFFELKPDVIIECGTYQGGSALFFSSLCDLMDHGRIYTVDVEEKPERPVHPRLQYVHGSSTDEEILRYLRGQIGPEETVLVILDSDHSRQHVRAELEAYATIVTPGSYIVVEDTNVNGHPVSPDYGPGPMEALEQFLAEHDDFVIDESREKFFLTFNPRGYLRFAGKKGEPTHSRVPVTVSGETAAYPYTADPGTERDTTLVRTARLVGSGKRVLDVGCGPGFLARRLREQGCVVTGVEANVTAANAAAQYCDRVIITDITASNWERDLGDARFDVIVINDVLEHLTNPAACLGTLRRFLKHGGTVISSVPNVAHGSIRLSLLAGEFEYRDLGLLDRTHVRFFTRRSLEALFDEAGYTIRTLEAIEFLPTNTEVQVPPDLPSSLTEWMATNEDARAYQFVVVAAPIRHGTETALRQRARELAAQNEDLRQRLSTLTFPADMSDGDDTGIENPQLRRRMLQLRATVLDLRRQLAQRQTMLERVQSQLLTLREEMTDLVPTTTPAQDEELGTLHEAILNHERNRDEVARYVEGLHDSIRLMEQQAADGSRYIRSLNDSLARKDAEVEELKQRVAALTSEQARRNATEDQLRVAENELAKIHSSRLWQVGGLYWRATDRLRGFRKR